MAIDWILRQQFDSKGYNSLFRETVRFGGLSRQRQESVIRPDLCQTRLSNQDAAHTFRSCLIWWTTAIKLRLAVRYCVDKIYAPQLSERGTIQRSSVVESRRSRD